MCKFAHLLNRAVAVLPGHEKLPPSGATENAGRIKTPCHASLLPWLTLKRIERITLPSQAERSQKNSVTTA
jgi:hypothetical protein